MVGDSLSILFGFLILDQESYEGLKGFFRFRSVEIDTGLELRLVDVANPEVSRELYELARLQGDPSQVFSETASPDDVHRLKMMNTLATLLTISTDERPCIAFVETGNFRTIATFKIEPEWYSTPEARAAFGKVLLDWIGRPGLERAILVESLKTELEKVRRRLDQAFGTDLRSNGSEDPA